GCTSDPGRLLQGPRCHRGAAVPLIPEVHVPERFALLSVSDKAGLAPFARVLVQAGFTILSTGGTARVLAEAGLPVTKVSEHTGAPEIMNGRVKTLHPKIHGGILGDRDEHAAEAAAHG